MTNQEILDLLAPVQTLGEISDDLIIAFMEHVDKFSFDEEKDEGFLIPGALRGFKKGRPFNMKPLLDFLYEFEASNPHIGFWFCWKPFRFFLGRAWDLHIEKHNEKVRREFPEERWTGLLLEKE